MFIVVCSQGRCEKLIVPVLTGGKPWPLSMTILIPNHVFVLAAKSLQQMHEIPVLGEAKAQVSYGDQQACLPVIVTAGGGPALMGRNCLSSLRHDWKQIRKISLEPPDKVENLVSKYASLFEEGLGTIEGVTPHLKLK